MPPGKPQGFPEEVVFILKCAEPVRDWGGDIRVPYPKVQIEGISLKGRVRLRGWGEEVGNGAVFEKAGQRSTWGSTAPLPSKSRKPPIFRGRGPSQAGGLRGQAQAEPSLVCIWEQAGCWTRGTRQTSIPVNGAPARSRASGSGPKAHTVL